MSKKKKNNSQKENTAEPEPSEVLDVSAEDSAEKNPAAEENSDTDAAARNTDVPEASEKKTDAPEVSEHDTFVPEISVKNTEVTKDSERNGSDENAASKDSEDTAAKSHESKMGKPSKSKKAQKSVDSGDPKAEDDDGKDDKKHQSRFKFDWEIEENLIEALDEDALDLTEADESETEPIEIEGKSAITLKQAVQTAFGLFLLVFSIIGVISTVTKTVEFSKARKDNSEQLEYFEDFLLPLAATDAPTFEGASNLNEDVIISAACWDIIFNPSAFYEFSSGAYRVSYLDIDRRITKLFGPGLNYSHKTVGDTELRFTYDEASGMYTIPAFPRAQAYYPDVTEINEVEGGLELTVQYHLPLTYWIESVNTVEKTMIYTVVPSDTDYNVTAIRIEEIDSSEAT